MANIDDQARTATSELLNTAPDELYVELGKRLQEIRRNPSAAGTFQLKVQPGVEAMGAEQLRVFGERFFKRMSHQAYALICGAEAESSAEREKLAAVFGLGKDSVAPALAAIIVVHLGVAPAIAAVVAVLAVRLFFRPGYEAMCEVWKENLPKQT